jgi:uncharacterized protein (DUF3820 family)
MEALTVLKRTFPFGKYKKAGKLVAEAIQDTSYLSWLKKENILSWNTGLLLQTLIKHEILHPDGVHLVPDKLSLCQGIVKLNSRQDTEELVEKFSSLSASETKTKSECIFCLDSLVNVGVRYAFYPCAHAIVCEQCGEDRKSDIKSIYKCPICRSPLNALQQVIKVFL